MVLAPTSADSPPTAVLQVFYDGACPLCRREMAHFQKRRPAPGHRVEWVDIAGPDFRAADYGLDPQRVHQVMHVRTPQGRMETEVRAFVEIWKTLPGPGTAFLRALLRVPGAMAIAGVLYRLFARNRYRLTGRCTPTSCSP